jgi:hypothetical protein
MNVYEAPCLSRKPVGKDTDQQQDDKWAMPGCVKKIAGHQKIYFLINQLIDEACRAITTAKKIKNV